MSRSDQALKEIVALCRQTGPTLAELKSRILDIAIIEAVESRPWVTSVPPQSPSPAPQTRGKPKQAPEVTSTEEDAS